MVKGFRLFDKVKYKFFINGGELRAFPPIVKTMGFHAPVFMKVIYNEISIECTKGDIANQPDVEAIVNAANSRLGPGGGVAGAIHEKAGPGLEQECKPHAPLPPGEAIITTGQRLPNRYIIHCRGPICGLEWPEEELLASCYDKIFELIEEYQISSIAIPAISTGNFGFPLEQAAEITFSTFKYLLDSPKPTKLKLIRMVLYSEHALKVHEKFLKKIL